MKLSILHYKTVQILPKNKLKHSEILLMMERLIITENILNLQTILMENGFTIFIMPKEIFIKIRTVRKDFKDKFSVGGTINQYEKQKLIRKFFQTKIFRRNLY